MLGSIGSAGVDSAHRWPKPVPRLALFSFLVLALLPFQFAEEVRIVIRSLWSCLPAAAVRAGFAGTAGAAEEEPKDRATDPQDHDEENP